MTKSHLVFHDLTFLNFDLKEVAMSTAGEVTVAPQAANDVNGSSNGQQAKVGTQLPPRIGTGSVSRPGGMQPAPITKYRPFEPVDLPDRQWPALTITTAPIWC